MLALSGKRFIIGHCGRLEHFLYAQKQKWCLSEVAKDKWQICQSDFLMVVSMPEKKNPTSVEFTVTDCNLVLLPHLALHQPCLCSDMQ